MTPVPEARLVFQPSLRDWICIDWYTQRWNAGLLAGIPPGFQPSADSERRRILAAVEPVAVPAQGESVQGHRKIPVNARKWCNFRYGCDLQGNINFRIVAQSPDW